MSKTTQRIQARLRIEELLKISKALNRYKFDMLEAEEKYTTEQQRKRLMLNKENATYAIRELIETERAISASLNQEDFNF